MIIYDREGLYNVKVVKAAIKYYHSGLITEEDLSKIKEAHPSPFYTPNLFVRIGFFILTCIISAFGAGLLSLIMAESGVITTCGWFIFLTVVNYVALEVLVQQNRYYKGGVDDALLWISGGLLVGAFIGLVDDRAAGSPVLISSFVLLVTGVFTLRFTDMLAAGAGYLAAFALVFFAWKEVGNIGDLTMPFVLIAFSLLSYRICKRTERKPASYFYSECILVVELLSLLTLYLSGNYYVVKELGDMLHGSVSKTIPLAWFFWFWTVALPFIYIAFGVKEKSLLLLRTGLLLIAAAVFTFRNYYHVLPVELALTFAGIVLIVLSWFLVQFLRRPKAGFTSNQLGIKNVDDELNMESLIVAETFSGVGKHAPEGTRFGGGQFGGGGSSSGY